MQLLKIIVLIVIGLAVFLTFYFAPKDGSNEFLKVDEEDPEIVRVYATLVLEKVNETSQLDPSEAIDWIHENLNDSSSQSIFFEILNVTDETIQFRFEVNTQTSSSDILNKLMPTPEEIPLYTIAKATDEHGQCFETFYGEDCSRCPFCNGFTCDDGLSGTGICECGSGYRGTVDCFQVPSVAQVSALALNATTLLISWRYTNPLDIPLIHTRITVYDADTTIITKLVKPNRTSLILNELTPGMQYFINATPIDRYGDGLTSDSDPITLPRISFAPTFTSQSILESDTETILTFSLGKVNFDQIPFPTEYSIESVSNSMVVSSADITTDEIQLHILENTKGQSTVAVTAKSLTRSQSIPFTIVSQGIWEQEKDTPVKLAEVSCILIEDSIYLVGESSISTNQRDTYKYNTSERSWSIEPPRLLPGHHHVGIAFQSEVYLFGGLEVLSEGAVQIYSPISREWRLGAPCPIKSGSASAVLIDDTVFYCGGIIENSETTNECAKYDLALDQWSDMPPMPVGRNHAAFGTDGVSFYVFGGRTGRNSVTKGFDEVQIFNTISNTWTITDTVLPEPRGGMGPATFHNGEFWIFGGETTADDIQNAENRQLDPFTSTFYRVDVYNPMQNSWRLESPLPQGKHGIHPILYEKNIYILAGGTRWGFEPSNTFHVL